ncbi:MAG: O-antigen ligase family protein [Pseudorhodoplanes sp.]
MGFWATACVLVLSIILGGGTRQGFSGDYILQLVSLPLLLASIIQLWSIRSSADIKTALLVVTAIAAVPLIQLIPLPPFVWTALPGREAFSRTFEIAGIPTPWHPISLGPSTTLQSALSLIPPLALFLGTLLLGMAERRVLSLVLLGLGVAGVVLGLLQVAFGSTTPLRFFAFTNKEVAVAFFANANHAAIFMASLIPVTGAWVVAKLARWRQDGAGVTAIPSLIGFIAIAILLFLAQGLMQSRAAIVLATFAALACSAMLFPHFRSSLARHGYIFAIVALVASAGFLIYRILPSIEPEEIDATRYEVAKQTLDIAWKFAPFGAGTGTFVPIYQMYESTQLNSLGPEYINRAHNDLAELLLESGAFGLVVLIGLVFWWVRKGIQAWSRKLREREEIDYLLPRAASIMIAVPLMHSLVDYPLRTGGMAAVLAVALGLLITQPSLSSRANRKEAGRAETRLDR